MKPAFALTFSETGISLLHQSDEDWYPVGDVALDDADFSAQVHALRDKGFALENDLRCKLVIPNDQIRYLAVPTEGLDTAECTAKVHAALTEATPYDLSELAFDTETRGPTTFVAAAARQTLQEARDFATDHGFTPVGFSAESDPQDFPRTPDFDPDAEITLAPLAAAEDPAPEPENDPEPQVHAIAATTAPEAFKSPEPQTMPDSPQKSAPNNLGRVGIETAVVLGIALAGWAMIGSDAEEDVVETVPVEAETPEPPVQSAQSTAVEDAVEATDVETTADEPDLTATDAAILEALKVAPTPVEQVARDPETQQDVATLIGLDITPPTALIAPEPVEAEEIYLSPLDNSNLSTDAVALPSVESFDTDLPFDQTALPSGPGIRFELDERGLVTPTPEGTLNPDGVTVYLGQPPSVPPTPPVRFEEEPVVDEAAQRLAGLRPRPRPDNLVEQFERQQLGGRSRQELAVLRPKLRPESLQARAEVDETPTALAVVRVPRPKPRPAGLKAPAPAANGSNLGSTAAIAQSADDVGSFQPKAVAPKIPSSASVARQATIDNAINLRRLNLIGVYGTPANRRALVRLPSGRYKKLKVGDRIDGGKVIAISDSELRYQKKGRNVTLSMPRS